MCSKSEPRHQDGTVLINFYIGFQVPDFKTRLFKSPPAALDRNKDLSSALIAFNNICLGEEALSVPCSAITFFKAEEAVHCQKLEVKNPAFESLALLLQEGGIAVCQSQHCSVSPLPIFTYGVKIAERPTQGNALYL